MSEPTAPAQWTTSDGQVVLPSSLPYERTADGVLGVEVSHADPERVVAYVDVDDRHRQPFGLLHGGVYALIAESAASIGGMLTAVSSGGSAVGTANNTSFLRPFRGEGRMTSTATRIHGGRTTQLWDVEHRDGDGRLCATSRVSIALLPPRAES